MPILKRVFLTLTAVLAAGVTSVAHGADQGCGMYPPAVRAMVYSGWSACKMRGVGERPLWRGLSKSRKQVIRFVFTQGHGVFFRVVSITQKTDGAAVMKVSGTRRRDTVRVNDQLIAVRRVQLSAAAMQQIDLLGEQSGTWEFETGTWDGDELYMHCQLLEMERADAAGYRYSSVNIGCNQPEKLMPLVREIVRLAGMRDNAGGMLFE
jgi:hypothetical protein